MHDRVAQLETQIVEAERARQLDGQQHRHKARMIMQQHENAVEDLKNQIRKLKLAQEQKSNRRVT